MRILFIGDIVGRPGRDAVLQLFPDLKRELNLDFVIANGENVSNGKGLNMSHANQLHDAGIDFFTTGNHIWKQHDIFPHMNEPDAFVIRPANYPQDNPGKGYQIVQTDMMKKLLIINLQGRVFVREDTDCPFKALDRILEETAHEKPDMIFVDFHAEATSEKVCLGLYAAGRVSALVGTHTHVPTADETILEEHTAYISDVGYVGLKNSAIGVDPEPIIKNFLTQMPVKHTITTGGPVMFNSVIIDIEGGKAVSIERYQREVQTQS
jgi:2',3'-cyclic-nucleotide 2'-phosphodiesterase